MKLNKKTSLLAVSLLAVAALAACGNNNETSSSEDLNIVGDVTVEWWVPYAEGNATMTYARSVADAFHAANPNITVNITSKGSRNNDYAGCAAAVNDALTGGNTPQMVTTYGTYVAAWRKAAPAAVADVTAHGQALEGDADFNQTYLKVEKDQYGDKYYSLPYSKSGEVVQYNKELFAAVGTATPGMAAEANPAASAPAYPALSAKDTKKAYSVPTTMTGWMDLARTIKADYEGIIEWGRYTEGDNAGYYKAVPMIYESSSNLYLGALESLGITAIDNSKAVGASPVFLNSQAAKDVAIQLKKWSNEGLLATAGQLPMRNAYSHEYPSTYVGKQASMIMITSTANGPYDAVDGFAMGFAKNPMWQEGAKYRTVSQGPSIAFFNNADANKHKAALRFYDFLTNGANSIQLAKQTYYFPTRTSSLEDDAIKAALAAQKAGVSYTNTLEEKKACYLGEIIENNNEVTKNGEYFMSPVNELSGNIRSAIEGMINNLFNDTTKTTDAEIAAMVNSEWDAMRTAILA